MVFKDGSLTPPTVNIQDNNKETNDNTNDPHIINEDSFLDDLFQKSLKGELDIDDIMVCAMHAGKYDGIKPEHLSKIWRIDMDTARKTLDITSQRSVRKDNPKLSRNYGTNDRMLRYKHLKDYFFMDTLFATKKASVSSIDHTCS